MKKSLLVLISILFCSPCSSFAGPKTDAPLGSVMVAMADGSDGTGVWLTDWLNEKNAIVKFDAALKTPSAFAIEGTGPSKRPVILINEDIKKRTDGYKYYAALIAREAAELVHIAMPDSAEKQFMINSCSAQVFFEMYGTRMELPVFSGVRDEVLGDQVNTWVENGPDSGADAVSFRTGKKLLKTLISDTELAISQAGPEAAAVAPLQKKLAALKAEEAYYNKEFKQRETYWWSMHQPQ